MEYMYLDVFGAIKYFEWDIPHISNMSTAYPKKMLSPRLPTRPHGNLGPRTSIGCHLPVHSSHSNHQFLKKPGWSLGLNPRLSWFRFHPGNITSPRCSPWCWNMNPNIYPKKITQFCRFLYTSTMVRIWVLMSIFCSDQKWESWKLPDWSKVLKTQHHCVINAFWPPLNQIHSRSAISSGVSGRLIPIFCWSISPHFAGARCPFLFHEIRKYQF